MAGVFPFVVAAISEMKVFWQTKKQAKGKLPSK